MLHDDLNLILGIDIGDNSSCVTMFDGTAGNAEVIDFSGGYGRASVLTMLQYIPETDEWIFGENAMQNTGCGNEAVFSNLLSELEGDDVFEAGGVSYSAAELLGIYIKELLAEVNVINPNASILGLVVSCGDYLSEKAKKELSKAVGFAGINGEVAEYRIESECVLFKQLYEGGLKEGKTVILDFGSSGLKGKVFEVRVVGDNTKATVVSSYIDTKIGAKIIENDVSELITTYYCEETGTQRDSISKETMSHLRQCSYAHKDLFFQKGILTKPVQLYFNFAYPPFRKTITSEISEQLIGKHRQSFNLFLNMLLPQEAAQVKPDEIDTVICIGGGFEMLWAKEAVGDYFKNRPTIIYPKMPKCIQAQGAALIGAAHFGLLKAKGIEIEDPYKVTKDIGILVKAVNKTRFLPFIEIGTFLMQENKAQTLILGESTESPVEIELYSRNENGEISRIESLRLEGLPIRPKGTTKLKLELKFRNRNELSTTITDEGFGEMFPKTDYKLSRAVFIE